jgi:acyl carrier protein
MTVKEIVLAAVARVCADKGTEISALSERDILGEGGLGLDSLDMATIVAELEAALDQDPFESRTPAFHTLGDLVALYAGARGL